jgi:hypothetical protein
MQQISFNGGRRGHRPVFGTAAVRCRPDLAFGIHFGENAPQRRRIAARNRTELFAEATLADGTNPIGGNLDVFACNFYRKTCPPPRMQLTGERTDNDGFQDAIQHIKADDYRGPSLAQFTPTGGIELDPMDVVPFTDH